MYTAKIIRKGTIDVQNEKRIVVDVEYYKDGVLSSTDQVNVPYSTTLRQIEGKINQKVEAFEAGDAVVTSITLGDVDLSGFVETPLTAAEIAKNTWFQKFAQLERVNKLVDLGAFPASKQAALDAFKLEVSEGFKPAYIAEM